MNLINSAVQKLSGIKTWFWRTSLRNKILIIVAVAVVSWFGGSRIINTKTQQPQYQTAQAEKGTLMTSVSASGTILQRSSVSITTNATGVAREVYVKDGDTVSKGDKIADLNLDTNSQQKQAAAWSSYLSAKNSLEAAQAKINSLQAAAFKANQTFTNDSVARGLAKDDPTYIQQNALWLQAEADYKNQAAVITQAQAALNSAWLSYVQLSSTITAPMTGKISGLTLSTGTSIATATSGSEGSGSGQTIGTITAEEGTLQASVNLTEIDVVKVKPGQKATLTLDAFPDEQSSTSYKTFTGKVATVNTNGSVSSGVTTYPATIIFDSALDNIYPNMAVNATIITDIKDSVILVPSATVQIASGQSTVRVMQNGQVTQVQVEVGGSNDTHTEITLGINEGDVVITGSASSTNGAGSSGATSPFGGFGGRGGTSRGGQFLISH